MMGAEFSVFLAVTLVASLGALVQMIRAAVPAFKAVREELEATPLTREMRFTVTETVVSWNDGTVVALPVRKARLARPGFAPVQLSEAA